MFLWLRGLWHRRELFFFQAEDGIRDYKVTGVQTCALPILVGVRPPRPGERLDRHRPRRRGGRLRDRLARPRRADSRGVGRGAWRGRGESSGGARSFKKKKEKRSEKLRAASRSVNITSVPKA